MTRRTDRGNRESRFSTPMRASSESKAGKPSNLRPARSDAKGHELRPPPREQASDLIYGFRAGIAVIERRLNEVMRIVFVPDLRSEISDLIERATADGIACDVMPENELSHLASSDQHEGLLVQTRPRRFMPPQALGELLLRTRGVAIAFDRVRNPYNIGAVLRTAAFFGIDAALLGTPAPHPALPPLAVRVAEGGAEHLAITRTTDLADTLSRLRAAGIFVAGAEDDGVPDALAVARTGSPKKPVVLVLGHEREGLSSRVRAQCDAIVAIRGTGEVRSLNVSVAASILIADLMR